MNAMASRTARSDDPRVADGGATSAVAETTAARPTFGGNDAVIEKKAPGPASDLNDSDGAIAGVIAEKEASGPTDGETPLGMARPDEGAADKKADDPISDAPTGSGCVVMYDDRLTAASRRRFDKGLDPFAAEPEDERDQPYDFQMSSVAMMSLNRAYAAEHGYEFRFRTTIDAAFDATHPSYWAKIKLLRDALYERRGQQYAHECVLWLDTDACVPPNNRQRSLISLFPPAESVMPSQAKTDLPVDTMPGRVNGDDERSTDGASLPSVAPAQPCVVFSGDQPGWSAYFCAGVFAVRNCAIARALFDEWLSRYDGTAWSRSSIDGHWQCSGDWGGVKYEQGVGCDLFQSQMYASHVLRKPWYFFNNHNYRRPNRGFTMHFAGIYKLYIEPFVRYVVPTLA